MSEPEISRRCSACGASVRPRALFCPQCGNGMANSPATADLVSDDKQSAFEPGVNRSAIQNSATSAEQSRTDLKTTPLNAAILQAAEKPSMSEREAGPGATSVGSAGFEDSVLGRVEKLRKVSKVVMDQAAYDPSLRFLLVAGVLFVLFLFLLILSKLIG